MMIDSPSEGINESLVAVLTKFYDKRRQNIKKKYISTALYEEDSAFLSTDSTAFMGNKANRNAQSIVVKEQSGNSTSTPNHGEEGREEAVNTSLNKSLATESTHDVSTSFSSKSTSSGGSGGASAASASQP